MPVSREDAFKEARAHARERIEEGNLMAAVAEYVGLLQRARIHPPLHHADITHGILMAEKGDEAGVREWIQKFQ
jgi:hypothetical protein